MQQGDRVGKTMGLWGRGQVSKTVGEERGWETLKKSRRKRWGRGQGRDTTLMKQNKPDGQSSTLASDSQIPTLVPLCRALADVMV